MIEELNKLAAVLDQWNCLESFKAIQTASIPVIKMVLQFIMILTECIEY
jgi:hypothetical protein